MPGSIAIIGASRDPDKFSHKAVKAYQSLGYDVYPVNPNADKIAGLRTFKSFNDLPARVEEVSLYLPPAQSINILPGLKNYPLKVLYLNPGSADDKVRHLAQELNLPVVEACSIVIKGLNPADY